MVGSSSSKNLSGEHPDQIKGPVQKVHQSEHKIWPAGTLVANKFEVLCFLGRGSSGFVYKVRNLETHDLRALKIPAPELLGSLPAGDAFLREFRIAAKLRHRHLLAIEHLGRIPDTNQVFFTMDLMEGGDLGKKLSQAILKSQPMDPHQVLVWMSQIAEAVAYIHDQGLIHQDIKPGNIMLDVAGDARLGDFGLAFKYAGTSVRQQLAQSTVIGGTTYFLSPEQYQAIFYQKKVEITQSSDVFAFGLTLYNLLSGEIIAGSRESILEFIQDPDLARAIDSFLDRSLARKPEKRFKNGRAMLLAFRQLMTLVPHLDRTNPRPQTVSRIKSKLWQSSIQPGTRRSFQITKHCEMTCVWIPSGAFQMGTGIHCQDRFEDEGPVAVELTQGFWMADKPVNQQQWKAIMGTQPSFHKGKYNPVEMITWYEAKAFIEKCNLLQKKLAIAMPTEAQWEYACLGGDLGTYSEALENRAWFEENSKGRTHRLGLLRANAWGLHDMLGNVWEWCSDFYEAYPQGAVVDPIGPRQGSHRIVRGGSFNYGARYCRPQARFRYLPDNKNLNIGFRMVAMVND